MGRDLDVRLAVWTAWTATGILAEFVWVAGVAGGVRAGSCLKPRTQLCNDLVESSYRFVLFTGFSLAHPDRAATVMDMVFRKRRVPSLAIAVVACLALGACTNTETGAGNTAAGENKAGYQADAPGEAADSAASGAGSAAENPNSSHSAALSLRNPSTHMAGAQDPKNSRTDGVGSRSGSGSGTGSANQTQPPQTPASPQPEHSAPAGLTALGNADGAPKTERVEAPAELAITDIRMAGHDGFDRIVFEMAGNGMPDWYVSYTEQPFHQGSGRPVEMDHLVALNINIDGTVRPETIDKKLSGPDLDKLVDKANDSASESEQELGVIKDFIPGGMHDGRSQYFLAMDMKQPFSVQVLRGPTRLVIDILH